MSTRMGLAFETSADTTGTRTIKSELADAEKGVAKFNESATGMTRRFERPLKYLAFSSMSDQVISMAGGVGRGISATTALENAFHVLGEGALFASPQIGLLMLAATAAFGLFKSISDSIEKGSAKTEEAIKKENDALVTQYEQLKKIEPILIVKSDLTKATKERLVTELEASKQSIAAMQKEYEMAQNNKTATLQQIDATKQAIKATNDKLAAFEKEHNLTADSISQTVVGQGLIEKRNQLTDTLGTLTQHLANTQAVLNGTESAYEQLTQKSAKVTKDKWTEMTKELQIQTQLAQQQQMVRQYQNIDIAKVKDIIAVEKENAAITVQLSQQTDDAKKTEMEHHIAYNDAKIASDQRLLQQEDAYYKTMAAQINTFTSAFGNAWTVSNNKVLFNAGKFASDMINDFATMYTSILEMEAAKDLGTGNFAGAALAIGEIAAIKSVAAIAGGFLGGGSSSSSSATSTSSGVSAAATSAATSAIQGNQANLTINITGGSVIDPSTTALIIKGINDLVQQNGYTLTATHLNGISPMPGT